MKFLRLNSLSYPHLLSATRFSGVDNEIESGEENEKEMGGEMGFRG